jgi:hypothetical protein
MLPNFKFFCLIRLLFEENYLHIKVHSTKPSFPILFQFEFNYNQLLNWNNYHCWITEILFASFHQVTLSLFKHVQVVEPKQLKN